MSAFIFINPDQALRFGHIAWGFELASGEYFYGSTDHLIRRPFWDVIALARYSSVRPGDNVDYWSGQGSFEQMLDQMSRGPHIRYQTYKRLCVDAGRADPERAQRLAETFENGGWTLWDNNCVHQTHRLLCAYGAGHLVPDPIAAPLPALIPVKYFDLAQGSAVICDPSLIKSGSRA